MTDRKTCGSGGEWEQKIGYSRGVRVGNVIEISGTTASKDGEIIGGSDPYAQAVQCLSVIKAAIETLGGKLEDTVKTRIYLSDINNWEAVGKAHGEMFADVKPAIVLLEVSALMNKELLVEIEATAVVSE
jgi:enamine deaminase RidA (YjgF/YER057c/UK114 family)